MFVQAPYFSSPVSLRRLNKNIYLLPLFLCMALTPSASAKQVGEALTDMGDVQGTDPNGYMLMMISIGILFTVATVLIGVTTMYMLKAKKKGN